jgi:hypothetical protein
LRRAYGLRTFTPLEPLGELPAVRVIEGLDERVRAYAANALAVPTDYGVTIIAGCTAGVLEHYLDDLLKPAQFENFALAAGSAVESARVLVYAVYQDYVDAQWEASGGFTPSRFRTCLEDFLTAEGDRQVFLLLASEKTYRSSPSLQAVPGMARRVRARLRGAHDGRIRLCNSIVRDVSGRFPNVTLIEMGNFVRARNEQRDPRHFERIVIRRVAEHVSWLATTSRSVARSG